MSHVTRKFKLDLSLKHPPSPADYWFSEVTFLSRSEKTAPASSSESGRLPRRPAEGALQGPSAGGQVWAVVGRGFSLREKGRSPRGRGHGPRTWGPQRSPCPMLPAYPEPPLSWPGCLFSPREASSSCEAPYVNCTKGRGFPFLLYRRRT